LRHYIRFGLADAADKRGTPIRFPVEHFMRHVFLCGKTGTGKTVTLINWCLSLAENLASDPDTAPGFTFIDPHGDAVNDLLERLPDKVAERVHILHFRDTDRTRVFNLLEAPPGMEEVAVGAFVDMLHDLFPAGVGYRMEHIIKNALLTLVRVGGQTILSLEPLLSSEQVRAKTLPKVMGDPVLRSFWETQFPAFAKKAVETLAPIWNKLGAFATYPRVRRVVGQPKSTIDPLKIMDEGHILLVDLAGAGEDVTPIMGGALVNRYHFSALARAGRPKNQRRPHVLIADEVHNYATKVMSNILSEDRKFGLGFVIATQFLNRVPEEVLDGILGNVGTLVVLGIEKGDAERLKKYFSNFTAEDLVQRPTFHAAVYTTAGGSPCVFTMESPLPPPGDPARAERILAQSDREDGEDAERVDSYISRLFALARAVPPQQEGGRGADTQAQGGGADAGAPKGKQSTYVGKKNIPVVGSNTAAVPKGKRVTAVPVPPGPVCGGPCAGSVANPGPVSAGGPPDSKTETREDASDAAVADLFKPAANLLPGCDNLT